MSATVSKVLFGDVFSGRRVFITGHTGFKGSWLAMWLAELGAEVAGYALEPPTEPSLFEQAGVVKRLARHEIGDVRDRDALIASMAAFRPDVVIHLAAQSLVCLSYEQPVMTFETNVMGIVNVLEAVRACPSVRVALNVTSDKCYENREWAFAYRENDAMGGYDPYSASKGAAELVTAAYRRSFFGDGQTVRVASARAGNVIGGGDWAADRIVPDCIRALTAGESILVRNPDAVRPWQHVLEPLSGYLLLVQRLWDADDARYEAGWNFGPVACGSVPVREVVDRIVAAWGCGGWYSLESSAGQPHEADILRLDCTKAQTQLGWAPVWDIDTAIRKTTAWYGAWHRDAGRAAELVEVDIAAYVAEAASQGVSWACSGELGRT